MQLPQIRCQQGGLVLLPVVAEFVAVAVLADCGGEGVASLRAGIVPVFAQGGVARAELILVDVTVLDDQSSDQLRVGGGQLEPDLRTEIMQPDDAAVDADTA